jgi:hypothetical protein
MGNDGVYAFFSVFRLCGISSEGRDGGGEDVWDWLSHILHKTSCPRGWLGVFCVGRLVRTCRTATLRPLLSLLPYFCHADDICRLSSLWRDLVPLEQAVETILAGVAGVPWKVGDGSAVKNGDGLPFTVFLVEAWW